MKKDVLYGNSAREKIVAGVNKLADAIKVTLGPKGRNVIIEQENHVPLIVNDGFTIASKLQLADRYENLGAQIVTEIASKTNEVAGDGTTTAIILSQFIINEGMKKIEKGYCPVALRKDLERFAQLVDDFIVSITNKVSDYEDLVKVATISANDAEVGKSVAKIVSIIKEDGTINIEESKGMDTTIDVVEGYTFDRGYLSPYMVNDTSTMNVVFENPLILLVNYKINNIKELLPMLEQLVMKSRPILLIVEDIDPDVLNTLIINKLRGTFNLAVVKAVGFGSSLADGLEDIAVYTKAKVIVKETGMDLETVDLDVLGSTSKVIITKDKTTILVSSHDETEYQNRITHLKSLLDNERSEYEITKLKKRLARLAGKVGIIRVGAINEVVLKEKKLLIEDALNATLCALKEGVVSGGGVCYLKAYRHLKSKFNNLSPGQDIILRSLLMPTWQIVTNSGKDGNDVVKTILGKDDEIGYDVETEDYVNMIDKGILDPTMVTRSALKNAVLISSILLTSEVGIVNKDVRED